MPFTSYRTQDIDEIWKYWGEPILNSNENDLLLEKVSQYLAP